jgi:hypothetical protein
MALPGYADGGDNVGRGKPVKESKGSVRCTRDIMYERVGCKILMWFVNSAGREYSSVRTISEPVSVWVNTEKFAPKYSLAFSTEIENCSQSPAWETALWRRFLCLNQDMAASKLSAEGLVYKATFMCVSAITIASVAYTPLPR